MDIQQERILSKHGYSASIVISLGIRNTMQACCHGVGIQPAVHAATMRGWHFFNQLRKLNRSQTPQCTDVHMPERFSFTDQTSPGAYLLPMPQAGAKGSLLMVNEGRHDTSLMTLRRNP